MTKLQRLVNKCAKKGFTFHSLYNHEGLFTITIHDAKKAGNKPVLEYSRDAQDYKLALDSWHRRGTIILAVDDSVNGAIDLALESLENLDK